MEKVKLLIIGAGPAGYVAAIRAAQLGLSPVLVEKNELGGTCLNRGCIPTKALIAAAEAYNSIKNCEAFGISATAEFNWEKVTAYAKNAASKNRLGVNYLLKKNKIRLVQANAEFLSPRSVRAGEAEFEAENIIIATGSKVKDIGSFLIDGKDIIGSDQALFQEKLPKSLAIIGGGAIGVEIGFIYRSFGVDVSIIEAMNAILPLEDKDISKELAKEFKKKKIKIHASVSVEKVEKNGDLMSVFLNNGSVVTAEQVLSSAGRSPNTRGLNLQAAGIALDKRGFVETDDHFKTNVDGIYAVGDVISTPMLAHTAEREGISVVEHIAGLNVAPINYLRNPACVYCAPQIASIGYRETQAEEAGLKFKVGKFPFSANGKATASNRSSGFVKVLIEEATHKILGVHIIGEGATDLIAEFIPAMNLGAVAEDVIDSIHPHPTLSEASWEAVLNALGRTIHF